MDTTNPIVPTTQALLRTGIGGWEATRKLSRARWVDQVRGRAPWTDATLTALKEDIGRRAPREHAARREAFFRDFEKRASLQQRYFVYFTLGERLVTRTILRKKRHGRHETEPERATITQFTFSKKGDQLVGHKRETRDRRPDLWKARLFSDLNTFLRPVYGPAKTYEQIGLLLNLIFDEPVISEESVRREIWRYKRS